MSRRLFLWIVIVVLFIAVLYLTFLAGSSTAQGAIQASVSSKSAAATSSYGGMVGGC